jgi:3-dehydroquinate synthase
MSKIDVNFKRAESSYSIFIEENALSMIDQSLELSDYSSLHIITDETVGPLYAQKLQDNLNEDAGVITINADENSKTVSSVENIWKELLHQGADRNSLVINLGGGLVGDVGGFAASTYMRGIDFIQAPTTLLAASDASIGGKTGVNYLGLKNMVGTFTQPKAVIIDTSVFDTLSNRLVAEGLAEIIKHGAISDETYFTWLEDKLPNIAKEHLTELLERSCRVKAEIVQDDESEQHARKLLNFGHTLGHALESNSHELGDILLHGEAVAVGMVAESRLGEQAGITKPGTTDRLQALLEKTGLPTELPTWAVLDAVESKLIHDKKTKAGQINWTLLEQIGRAKTDCKIKPENLQNLFTNSN